MVSDSVPHAFFLGGGLFEMLRQGGRVGLCSSGAIIALVKGPTAASWHLPVKVASFRISQQVISENLSCYSG